MKYGINTFLFASPFKDEHTRFFDDFKEWGFDAVEVVVENDGDIDPSFVKDELDKRGLACASMCGAFGPGRDLRGTPNEQRDTIGYIERRIDMMETLDTEYFVGPIYSAVGRTELYSTTERKEHWQLVVKNLQELGRYAEERGKKLGVEPLNRFETDFLNSCEQGMRLVEDVGSPAVRLHLDTFHMNIEEKNPAEAVRRAGDLLGHFHACGSDRGTPGNDHMDWAAIGAALRDIGYDGNVVIESFTEDVKVIARAASIWREFEPDKRDIAREGIKFLRKTFG